MATDNRSKYNEFVLCMKKTNGEGSDKCTDLRRLAKTLCLDEWVSSLCFICEDHSFDVTTQQNNTNC